MGCSSCGKNIFTEKIGKCRDCIYLSAATSVLFWTLWCYNVEIFGETIGHFAKHIFLFLALFVNLLFIAHILAYLNDRRQIKNETEKNNTSL